MLIVFYRFSSIVTYRAFYMTKCDENHSKNLDILQYEITLGTYFTICLCISVWLFPLRKMNELQHDNQQKDLCTQWIHRLAWAGRMKKLWVLTNTHWAHSEDWSDWVDVQADLSLRWAHKSFCWFCHASSQMVSMNTCREESTIFSFAERYIMSCYT